MPNVLPDVAVLRRAVEYAVHAPSTHNSQPWAWRIGPAGVDLLDEGTAADERDALLSCGAALHHLLVALAAQGWSAHVERFPDPERPDHLARVVPVDAAPSPGAVRLAGAIPRRRTDRRRFGSRHVDPALLDVLARTAAGWGAHLHVVAPGDARRRLLDVLARSGPLRQQEADYAAALARSAGTATPARSPHGLEHVDAAALAVLSGRTGDRTGALRAGEATSAVLLTATDLGLATTPLSRPLAPDRVRASVGRDLPGPPVFPQVVLRLGWARPDAPPLPPTPRRALDEVLRAD